VPSPSEERKNENNKGRGESSSGKPMSVKALARQQMGLDDMNKEHAAELQKRDFIEEELSVRVAVLEEELNLNLLDLS